MKCKWLAQIIQLSQEWGNSNLHPILSTPPRPQMSSPTGLAHFPECPVVKNPPCNAGDVGLTLGWRTKILHATEQISPRTMTRESTFCKYWTHEPKLENSCVTMEGHKTKTRCTQINFLSAKFINFVMSGFFFNPKSLACSFSLTLPSYPESSLRSQPRASLGCSAFVSEMSLFLRGAWSRRWRPTCRGKLSRRTGK